MSSRTIRKLFGTTELPPLEGNSDEEFEPLFTKDTNSKFSGLVLSSHSESEKEVPEISEAPAQTEEKKKKKKKNKNNKNKQRRRKSNAANKQQELDEIDKSVMEVNAILGCPPPACVPVEKKVDPRKQFLSVQAKHLDHNNELKKMFGSESLDDSRGKKCRPHNVIKYRRGAIVPIPENRHYVSVGLSMSLQRRENDPRSYFTFDHNREYQKMHQHFLEVMSHEDVVPADDNYRSMHIEGLLQSADYLFRAEEYTAAKDLLEQIISYLHYIAHPCFNLTDQSIRLEYKYMENRPFHIAVLKYCHMLTNKACHRTALELAKLLLNLDPSDPLAIIFIIDTIALRAREHQWLIDTVDYWNKERDAGYLFNIKYSYAMAHFHVARKSKSEDYTRADELVKEAMLYYPTIATRLLENCQKDCSRIINHPYFSLTGEDKFPEKIKTAMIFHTKMVYWRWREPEVMEWLLKNGNELVVQLENDPEVKKRSEALVRHRHSLYAACPDQIHRHLHVVRPMANLLVEWEIPQLNRQASWDPLPPIDGINRYGYGVPANVDPQYYTGFFNLFASLMGPEQQIPEELVDRIRRAHEPPPPGPVPYVEPETTENGTNTDPDDFNALDALNAINAINRGLITWNNGMRIVDCSAPEMRRRDVAPNPNIVASADGLLVFDFTNMVNPSLPSKSRPNMRLTRCIQTDPTDLIVIKRTHESDSEGNGEGGSHGSGPREDSDTDPSRAENEDCDSESDEDEESRQILRAQKEYFRLRAIEAQKPLRRPITHPHVEIDEMYGLDIFIPPFEGTEPPMEEEQSR